MHCEIDAADVPKRFTIYEPMLLLPSTFPEHSTGWTSFYGVLAQAQRAKLFGSIATAFCRTGHKITHIAMNAPIAPTLSEVDVENEKDNVMRSPVHFKELHGDFGPVSLLATNASEPTDEDFEAAFWVETSQLTGIKQVWAPRWSMFSRGNVREKARILGFAEHNSSFFPGLTEQELGEPIAGVDVVDMYVGIGYFAISYLKKGVRRVFGWDINPWSIEALRRGCARNGFECEVVKIGDKLDADGVERTAEHVQQTLIRRKDVRCIAFLGNNQTAGDTIAAITRKHRDGTPLLNVRHCNLGLLPSSENSWPQAVKAMDCLKGGWLHVHENADIKQVDQKKDLVECAIRSLVDKIKVKDWSVACEHVEMVKTYAPGVGHFVFDIWIGPSASRVNESTAVS